MYDWRFLTLVNAGYFFEEITHMYLPRTRTDVFELTAEKLYISDKGKVKI